ncbi:MAG: hypothetical protein V1792_00410 [Pseudomonadota bacterium]
MIEILLQKDLDMVAGVRVSGDPLAYRQGHVLGNRLFTALVAGLFGKCFDDIFTGYRVCSHRFVKSFVPWSSGFEIETELTVHSLQLQMAVAEVKTVYRSRPEGSNSKLSTIRDGLRILKTVLLLLKNERPFYCFLAFSLVLAILALVLAYPLLEVYARTGLVPRFPTAFLCASLMVLAALSFMAE